MADNRITSTSSYNNTVNKVNYDLNGDGKVDEKDVQAAIQNVENNTDSIQPEVAITDTQKQAVDAIYNLPISSKSSSTTSVKGVSSVLTTSPSTTSTLGASSSSNISSGSSSSAAVTNISTNLGKYDNKSKSELEASLLQKETELDNLGHLPEKIKNRELKREDMDKAKKNLDTLQDTHQNAFVTRLNEIEARLDGLDGLNNKIITLDAQIGDLTAQSNGLDAQKQTYTDKINSLPDAEGKEDVVAYLQDLYNDAETQQKQIEIDKAALVQQKEQLNNEKTNLENERTQVIAQIQSGDDPEIAQATLAYNTAREAFAAADAETRGQLTTNYEQDYSNLSQEIAEIKAAIQVKVSEETKPAETETIPVVSPITDTDDTETEIQETDDSETETETPTIETTTKKSKKEIVKKELEPLFWEISVPTNDINEHNDIFETKFYDIQNSKRTKDEKLDDLGKLRNNVEEYLHLVKTDDTGTIAEELNKINEAIEALKGENE